MKQLMAIVLLAFMAMMAVPCPSAWAASEAGATRLETQPDAALLAKFQPAIVPFNKGVYIKAGDRLAICGDSITEQKMYSRIMETYLTVTAPERDLSIRQFGWSGETAPGFLARMTNDCLRFKPTVATLCYGMNDHGYRPYEPAIGQRYREAATAIVRAFKAADARVILGSAGCVGKNPPWSQATNATVEALNLNLCQLRNIGIDIAETEKARFADVFWPMLMGGYTARQKYGSNYAIAGGDGVHPDWAGHLVMAYAFLKSLGVDGEIGKFTVNLRSGIVKASRGHEVVSFNKTDLTLKSRRYPYCADGDPTQDSQIRSGMSLVPFNQDLNRLTLMVIGGKASHYKVTWGQTSRTYSAELLSKGINLAVEFPGNPFTEPFNKVDAAVKAKQDYETVQIKTRFHGPEGQADMEATVAKTEKERDTLVAAIKTALVPVVHTIRLEPAAP